MKALLGILNKVLSIFGLAQQTEHDNHMREDGARERELEVRDAQDDIEDDADEHREKDNSDTDADVIDRL